MNNENKKDFNAMLKNNDELMKKNTTRKTYNS